MCACWPTNGASPTENIPTTLVNTTPSKASAANASASPAAHAADCLSSIALMAALSSPLICTIAPLHRRCANDDWDGSSRRDACGYLHDGRHACFILCALTDRE